jgi:hypothetical protein
MTSSDMLAMRFGDSWREQQRSNGERLAAG